MAVTIENPRKEATFTAAFGSNEAAVLRELGRTTFHLPLPWLAGDKTESEFREARSAGESHGFLLHESGELLVGCALQSVGSTLSEATRDLYQRLLAASAGRPLCRIWNYVPAINAQENGTEHYHAFCAGRSQAFEAAYGPRFTQALPAASAVGCGGDTLAVIFVAGRAAPRYLENPEQVPAYCYPPEHGVRSPSFSRATIAPHGGRSLIFISGTAAIKGHATIAPGALTQQLDCTLDNLRIIGRAAGLDERLGSPASMERHFKIYLRQARDLAAVRARLERDLLRPEDRVIYLQAEICRATLELEIEATLLG